MAEKHSGDLAVNEGYRVLLIDADPQGSLTVSLGVKNPDELTVSLASVLKRVIDDRPVEDIMGIIQHTISRAMLF